MGDQFDGKAAKERPQRNLGPLKDPVEKSGAQRHHSKGFPNVLREDGHNRNIGLQGGPCKAQPLSPEHLVGMVAKLRLKDAAGRDAKQRPLAQQLCTRIHTARRAAEHVQNDAHARHPVEELVHHRVDDHPLEQEHPVDEVVVVHGDGAVVIDQEAAAALLYRQILQAAYLVAVPKPGMCVPKGGDNLPACLPKVSVLKDGLLQAMQQALPVGPIDVENEGGEVDEDDDEGGQDEEGENDGGEQPPDPQHVVQVHVGGQAVKRGPGGVDNVLAEQLQAGDHLILGR